MEHRWGARVTVDLAVRLASRPYNVRTARLLNLSLSGDHAPKPILELLRHAALHSHEQRSAARYQPSSDEQQSTAEA